MRGFEPFAWLLQVITGISMLFLITIHFFTTHSAHDLLSYERAVSRLSRFDYKIFYSLLLIFVCFHAFNGLRAIILDTESGMKRKRLVNFLIALIAGIAIAYGLFLLTRF
ncbi:MAG: succinate dehydrogenase [Archaeoglobaceae archaeon]|nr:succinate dehydrogenase [Archaeoglobaceae archaeon]